MAEKPIKVDYPAPGVRVETFDESSPVRLRVRSETAMAGWVPYETDVLREESSQVATTVEYRGVEYAIAQCRQMPSEWQYDLIPWPEGELVWRTALLAPEFSEATEEDEGIEREKADKDRLIAVASFVIAFLPASVQERFGEKYDYNAVYWTKINSALTGFLNLAATVLGVAAKILATGNPLGLLIPYLVVDSMYRLGSALAAERPKGLLVLELVDLIIRKIHPAARDRVRGETEFSQRTGRPFVVAGTDDGTPSEAVERTEPAGVAAGVGEPAAVAPTPEAPAQPREQEPIELGEPVEVDESTPGFRVALFSPESTYPVVVYAAEEMRDWVCYETDSLASPRSVATTIHHRGRDYAIAAVQPSDAEWAYALTVWPEADLTHRVFVISREAWEQREQERIAREKQARRDKIANWVGILVAFLPASIQERISESYDYDAPRWTALNAAAVGFISTGATIVNHILIPMVAFRLVVAGIETGTPMSNPMPAFEWTVRGILNAMAPYFIIESFVRYGTAVAGHKPMGLLPLELVDWIVRLIWRLAGRLTGRQPENER